MNVIINNKELMKEWDWDTNEQLKLDPHKLTCGSQKKVWWICSKNHKWDATIYNRVKNGSNCPFCTNKKPIIGYNDLSTLHPELIKEWNWNKNINIDPKTISEKSQKKVWWVDKFGHEWQSTIASRTYSKSNCPYCSGNKVLIGFNDLTTTHPKLCKEWDFNKNQITPDHVSKGSNLKVYWICEFGHSWCASINRRTKGDGCPICSNRQVLQGYNDLKTLYPNIAEEWDYKKNMSLYPEQFVSKSDKKVWWICKYCKHEWKTRIVERVNGTNCPKCAKIFKTSFPEMATYFYLKKYCKDIIWNYKDEKINNFEIDIYSPIKNIGIEYDGECWHQNIERDKKKDNICYNLNINIIRIREPNCPKYDSNCKFIYLTDIKINTLEKTISYILNNIFNIQQIDINIERDRFLIEDLVIHKKLNNSLLHKFPEIAKEWHPFKNGNLLPEHILSKSRKKIWWKCHQCGNEWIASVQSRTNGRGCFICSRKRIIQSHKIPVRCIELNKIFDSAMEAKKQLGIDNSAIGKNCSGIKKSAGKHPITQEPLHWEYVELKKQDFIKK